MLNLFSRFLPIALVLALLVLIATLVQILIRRRRATTTYPYQKEPALFTQGERSFLGVLEQALGQDFRILGKVRLADLLRVHAGLSASARQTAFNRIQSKHVDFVACDPRDLSVRFVIELDDKSHGRLSRQDRDEFVERALAAAGIPLLRFRAKSAYSLEEIRHSVFPTKKAGY